MIVKPKETDKVNIYNLWKTIFSHADGGFINYFFNEKYRAQDFYLSKENNSDDIIAGLYCSPQTLSLNGQLFSVSVLDNLFTLYKHRNKGVMTNLLNKVIEELEYNQLFTLIKCSQFIDFKSFGFETIYYKKRYTINRSDLFNVDGYSISNIFKTKELSKVYNQFIAHFNGFLIRDLAFFEDYQEMINASGKEIFVTRDQDRQIKGYMVYDYVDGEMNVLEIVYLDSTALLTLLNQAMGMNAYIYVDVSQSENIELLIKEIDYQVIDYMMIRINDKELYKRFFNTKSTSIKSALKSVDKPLYIGYY